MRNKRDVIIFFIALFGLGIRINLVGSISITELFVLTQIPHLWKWIYSSNFPELKKICYLFGGLILIQIINSFLQNASIQDLLKSVMISLEALLLMLFFAEKLIRNPKLSILIPISNILKLIILGDQFGFANEGEMSYFKFYVAPIVSAIACIIVLQTKYRWFNKNPMYVFGLAGIYCIVGGARSLGFSLLFTTIIIFIIKNGKYFSFQKIWPQAIVLILLFQFFYANVYIPKVQTGEWGSSQNRQQLASINNSRNVFMMLLAARTDFFVSWIAFKDKPLLGHGYMAKDYKYKYAKIQAKLINNKINATKDIENIPAHSVLLGYGVYHGLFALLLFFFISYIIYRMGFRSMRVRSKIRPYLVYTIIASMQLILFGPPAILKNNVSLSWAIIIMCFYLAKKYETKTYCSNRSLLISKE